MAITPEQFTKSLADLTRLRILMLLVANEELCVCDFTSALELPQPKVSRHLAILRGSGVLLDRRAGQWIHYRLHPDLPAWAADALADVARGCIGKQPYESDRQLVATGMVKADLRCS
jgi:ArsR family transcriptional regulator